MSVSCDLCIQKAMTAAQLMACENTVNEIIKTSPTVYTGEASLSLAKDIRGLRAVFDEVSS